MEEGCNGLLHPQALKGLKFFNDKQFFEAHEALEDAWREEQGPIRELYRGILQAAVVYLHIQRGNYNGAVKVHGRSMKWLREWAEVCRGVHVGKLRNDLDTVIQELQKLGREKINEFDSSLLKEIVWNEKRFWSCDRCGNQMHEKNCKVTCPNCGNRFDCSDLNLYFD